MLKTTPSRVAPTEQPHHTAVPGNDASLHPESPPTLYHGSAEVSGPIKSQSYRARVIKKKAKFAKLREDISRNWFSSLFEDFETRQFRVGRMLVEMQTKDHQEDNAFNYVANGLPLKLDEAINKCRNNDECLDLLTNRDGAGATIIHIAYLYKNYDIGKNLLKRFPELSVLRYSRVDNVPNELMPYLGENILHMAIASRNYEEVKWLLDFHLANNRQDLLLEMLSARCFGHFFQPDFKRIGVYFGELPVHFAVCSNDLDIVDLFVEVDPDSIFFQDSHGNNALHLCVIHSLERMFDYVLMHAENIIRKKLIAKNGAAEASTVKSLLCQHALHVFNNEALTPFTLAAAKGKEDMFRHLLTHRKKKLWTYGPVECSVVDLTNLDTIQMKEYEHLTYTFKSVFDTNESSSHTQLHNRRYPPLPADADMGDKYDANRAEGLKHDRFGAIELICKHNHLEMLNIPEVKEIIEKKWDRFGKPKFNIMSTFGLCRTILITAVICTFEYSEGGVAMDKVAIALYCLLSACMAINFIPDMRKVLKFGLKQFGYGGMVRGSSMLENICSALECVFFCIACIVKVYLRDKRDGFNYDDSPVRIFIALTALVSWIRMYYVLMGFELTGKFVVIVFNILGKDIPLFLCVYVTILLGFGSSHAILSLTDKERTIEGGFRHFFLSIWGLFKYTMDGQNFGIFDNAVVYDDAEWLYQILQVSYNLCIVLLMLNLLIAMMSETYADLNNKSQIILARERYNMMCSFEMGLSEQEKQEVTRRYAICSGNKTAELEMQTINDAWIAGGSAATEALESKMLQKHIDMPSRMQLQASEGETDALLEGLKRHPEMLNSRDPVILYTGVTCIEWILTICGVCFAFVSSLEALCFTGHVQAYVSTQSTC